MRDAHEYLLTIAVPTYNGARTIKNMLDILLPQVDDRVEVLVSDNCSTDETPQIIAAYREKYPFIKYVRNEENLGADRNCLKCVYLAKGKYLIFISDDDIIVEGAIAKIIAFLYQHNDISLAYLETVGFTDHYINVAHCNEFRGQSKKVRESLTTTDKKTFMQYVGRQLGFLSSFVYDTQRCKSIEDAEKFYDSYWLQGFIQVLCSDKKDDVLGVIAGPCVAAGSYGIMSNYDYAKVEGVYYKRLVDFAIDKAGYDKRQLYKLWLWHACYVSSREIIKEKSMGISKTSAKDLFDQFKGYPYAWIHLFPYLIIPAPVCRFILKTVRKLQGRPFTSYVNRPTN